MARNKSFLLDTHIFIWWLQSNKHLTTSVKKILSDTNNTIYISVVTVWEMFIKIEKGKLRIPRPLDGVIKKTGFSVLPITLAHVFHLPEYKKSHKDPFDRMLVAQSQVEKLALITQDEKLKQYKVKILT